MLKPNLSPYDARISFNIICDGIAALAFVPLVDISFAFAEVPVRCVAYCIIVVGVATIVYLAVNKQIPLPEAPLVENEGKVALTAGETAITVPKRPSYPPKSGSTSAIRYKRARHAIVLLPYAVMALVLAALCIVILLDGIDIATGNGILLSLAVACFLLILFDRRYDVKIPQRIQTGFLCALLVAAVMFVWSSQQPISVFFGQAAIVVFAVVLKIYLWRHTWIVITPTVILYVILTPFGNMGPSIEIKSAGAPNITQTLLDIVLKTCSLHLDTANEENGRWKPLRWVVAPDEIRPLFGQPTSEEIKRNTQEAKLRSKEIRRQRGSKQAR